MSIRQVYVVENEDWLAPKSALTDAEAYAAILALPQAVTDEQWSTAVADLGNAEFPFDERHRRYVEMTGGRP